MPWCISVTVLLEYFDLFDNVAGPLPGPLNKVGPTLLLSLCLGALNTCLARAAAAEHTCHLVIT